MVITFPASSRTVCPRATRGSSCTSRPKPCPVLCTKYFSNPFFFMPSPPSPPPSTRPGRLPHAGWPPLALPPVPAHLFASEGSQPAPLPQLPVFCSPAPFAGHSTARASSDSRRNRPGPGLFFEETYLRPHTNCLVAAQFSLPSSLPSLAR